MYVNITGLVKSACKALVDIHIIYYEEERLNTNSIIII